jgi:hypothetical protein
MKWAAGILGLMLYLVWPYYTLIELAQAIQSGDAQAINQMVDWRLVRTSVKAQFQADLENMPKSAAEHENPAFAAFGNAFALTLVNSLVDKMLTPEGLTALIQGMRSAAPTKTSQGVKAAATPSGGTTPQRSLSQLVRFAFFVSPIHFQLDLREPDRGPETGSTRPVSTLTVMMMFEGTGWQVSDVRLSKFDRSLKVAQAPN